VLRNYESTYKNKIRKMGQILGDMFTDAFDWFTFTDNSSYWETNPINSIFTGEGYVLMGQMSEDVQALSDMMAEYQAAN
jgi:acetyl esterase/lipase